MPEQATPTYGGYSLDDLWNAIIQVESSGGTNAVPRYEPGFQHRYLKGKPEWEKLADKYGWQAVSSSYGPAQIMFPVAYELGYRGEPSGLSDPAVNRQYFEGKFTKDYGKVNDLTKAFLRYNGGGDPNYPNRVMQYLPPLEKALDGQYQQIQKKGSKDAKR